MSQIKLSQIKFGVNYSLCVPWHFMRPMAFYASHQHFMRPMTFYASHGILCVNQDFINTAFNTCWCVYLRLYTHANSMDRELLLLLQKSINLYILSWEIQIKWAKVVHWKCYTVWMRSIRHSFFMAEIIAFQNIVE